jgi:hypothetical protein
MGELEKNKNHAQVAIRNRKKLSFCEFIGFIEYFGDHPSINFNKLCLSILYHALK